MKYQLLAICFIASFYLTDAFTKEEEEKFANKCKEKLSATEQDMQVLDDVEALPKKRIEYCLLACYYKATGTMISNNTIVYDKAILEIESLKKEDKVVYDKLAKILQICSTKSKPVEDECDSLKIYLDCVMNKSKEDGLHK